MRLPCQRMARSADRKLLVIASGAHLQVADLGNGQILSSRAPASASDPKGAHFGLIRLLVIHQFTPPSDNSIRTILISTGEDKMLKTWELPALKLLQSRELAKRATALSVSPNGKNIVIGDKSGDIYNLPFDAPDNLVFAADPDQEPRKDPKGSSTSQQAEPNIEPILLAPIAGHVSILTSLTFILSRPHPSLVTADRDEHIRISRYPKSWSIENYLLGHQRFVGSLLWVAGNRKHDGFLLSGGGEDEIYVWNPNQTSWRRKISVKALSSGLRVKPEKEAWFMKTRKNQRRQKGRVANGETSKEDEAQADGQSPETLTEVDGAAPLTETGAGRKTPLPDICIDKMICTTSANAEDECYIIVSSTGSSVLAILPVVSALAPPGKHEDQARYYDFRLPILDFVDTSHNELLVSLDTSQDSKSESRNALRGLVIAQDKIFESQSIVSGLDDLNINCSIEESSVNPMPTASALYPGLLLLHKGHLNDRKEDDEIRLPSAKRRKQTPQKGKGTKQGGRMLSNQRVEKLLEAKAN